MCHTLRHLCTERRTTTDNINVEVLRLQAEVLRRQFEPQAEALRRYVEALRLQVDASSQAETVRLHAVCAVVS